LTGDKCEFRDPPAPRLNLLALVSWLLLLTLSAAGLLLAARAFFGPLSSPVRINSPMNAAGIFGCAAALLLAFGRAPSSPPIRATTARLLPPLLALLLTAALFWPSLTFPLLSDDYTHVLNARRPEADFVLRQFTIPAGDRFFRPLGIIDYKVESLWAGTSGWRWRFTNLVWHLANCLLLYAIARKLGLNAWPAALAAALFGVHGSRPEVVAWIAARFDLLAAFFSLTSVLAFLRYLETNLRRWLALSLAAGAAALLSKEAAFVLPLMLVLVAGRSVVARWRALAAFAGVTAAVFLYRWQLLGGIGGYLDRDSGAPTILQFNLARIAKALLLRLWSTLWVPVNWTKDWDPWLPLLLLAIVAAVAVTPWRSSKRAAFSLAAVWILALPVQHLMMIGPDLEKSRVVYLPSAAFALLTAFAIAESRSRRAAVAAGLLVAFQAAALQRNLDIWGQKAWLARSACGSVAAALAGGRTAEVLGAPNIVDGIYFLFADVGPCAELNFGVSALQVQEEGREHRLARPPDLRFRWNSALRRFDLEESPESLPAEAASESR
jgi:hypothetical protein